MAPRPSWPAGVGGTRALRFEPLDRCRLHAVLLDGNGSGYDDTIVDPQTLILILRDAREIDVDALAVVGGDHQRVSRDPQHARSEVDRRIVGIVGDAGSEDRK